MHSDEFELAKSGAIAKAGSAMGAFWLALGEQDLLALEGLILDLGVEALDKARDPKSGRAPVEWSCFLHRHDALGALLAHGFDKESAGGLRCAPLLQAVESHCLECLSVLIQAGASLACEDGKGRSALVLAANLKLPQHSAKMIEALLAAGCDANQICSRGAFALGASASNDKPADIKALVAAQAEVDLHAGDGFTALFYAVDNGSCEAAEALLRAGADYQAKAPALVEGAEAMLDPLGLAREIGDSAMSALLYSFAEAASLRERIAKIAPGSVRSFPRPAARL